MFKKIISSKLIIFGVPALLVALGVFGFFHYRNAVFSKEVLQLEISGPVLAPMGQEISYTVRYKNRGNFVLEDPKLVFELPEHSLTEDSKNRISTGLQDLNPGDADSITFKVRLLGREGDMKTARARLTYTPRNLSARYESVTVFTTKIEEVALRLGFNLPDKLEKNKEISYALDYASDVDYPLENLSVKIASVNGFSISSSDPESLDNVEWKLPILEKNGRGTIIITGLTAGDADSKLAFSALLGMRIKGVFVVLKEAKQEVEVVEPKLVISREISGFSEPKPSAGETLHYQITFKNTGEEVIGGGPATVRLAGQAFDFSTLQSMQGQVQADRSISFFLPSLGAGQEAVLNFSVRLKNTIEETDTMVKTTVNAAGFAQEFADSVSTGSASAPPLDLNLQPF